MPGKSREWNNPNRTPPSPVGQGSRFTLRCQSDGGIFLFGNRSHGGAVAPILLRLPELCGAPIRIETVAKLRDRHGPVHAGSFIRERRIAFDCEPREFPRVLVHELFHFVWVRQGNPARRAYEAMLGREILCGQTGELGWSAEWRKNALTPADIGGRTRRWREYACESFCDSAAWLFSGTPRHGEYTLGREARLRRKAWFFVTLKAGPVSI